MFQVVITVVFFLSALVSSAEDLSQNIPYKDTDFACISASEADKYINDFNINTNSFGGKELCNSEVDTKKLLNDIRIVENGRFTSGTNNLIKNFVDGTQYYNWLKSQTRGVERGNDTPWATAYNSGGYFTMQDGWAHLSTLGRVGTFIHEARHTSGYFHIPCKQGPYQGLNLAACDSNYSYGGSHAVEMEYYAKVSVQGVNFHPVYKKMARLMAIARSNFVFNTPVIQPHEAVLALRQDGSAAELFDNGKNYLREAPEFAGRLKRTSFGAVVFDGIHAFVIEMYKNTGFPDLIEDTYSYYKLMKEAQNIKDYEEFDSGIKRYVVKISQDNRLAAFNFPKGEWGPEQQISFPVLKTMTSIPGETKSGMYVIGTDGKVYSYIPESQRLENKNTTWDPLNKEVVLYKNQNLILRQDGRIYAQSANSLQPWSESSNLFSGLITVPIYDAFDVVKE